MDYKVRFQTNGNYSHFSKQWGNGKLIDKMRGAALEGRSGHGPYLS